MNGLRAKLDFDGTVALTSKERGSCAGLRVMHQNNSSHRSKFSVCSAALPRHMMELLLPRSFKCFVN